MKFLSVCSGIEAASVAWEPLGFEAVGFSEIDKFPAEVLTARFPGVKNFGDMNNFKEWEDELGEFDILVGGTPCQSFSIAGLRGGLEDSRGNLMLTFGRIAAHYRPRYLVWENVPGVLSSNRGRDFASFLGLLTGQKIEPPAKGWRNSGAVQGIDSAYGVAWTVLDAQFVRTPEFPRAVPQRRRRVFVVGYLGDWRRAAEILLERKGVSGNPPTRRAARKEVTGDARTRIEGRGGLIYDMRGNGNGEVVNSLVGDHASRPTDYTPIVIQNTDQGIFREFTIFRTNSAGQLDEQPGVSAALTVQTDPATQIILHTEVAITPKGEGFDSSEDGTGRQNLIAGKLAVYDMTNITHPKNCSNPQPGDPCHTLARGQYPPHVVIPGVVISIRRLVPVECERLQGFPDDWTRIPRGKKDAEECPDGPRYKAVGNSMAVNVMQWIGKRIQTVNNYAEGV